jgi:hypothetical protein
MVACAYHPRNAESTNRRFAIQASLSKKQDPTSKVNRAKRAGGVAQAAEHLPSKYKAEFKPQYCQKVIIITNAKRAGRLAQVVEHLPNKCKALGSNSRTAKTKNVL